MFRLFVVTAPGLESCTQQELAALSINASPPKTADLAGEPREEAGGLEFEGSLADIYRVNLHLRTASRVLVRIGDFHAAAFSELHKKAARLDWAEMIRPGQPVAVRAVCHKSKLYHSDGVAQRVAQAISDRLGQPAPLLKFDEAAAVIPQLVTVRLVHDHCTISVDTSGALLHRRGYRLQTAKAPLRETLAAGLLLLSGWDTVSPLLDPFCGSGTIPIEAALMAGHIAPGKNRRFAFMDWPAFDAVLWKTLLQEAAAGERPSAALIQGSDRDAGAIKISQANAGRAAVLETIQFTQRAVSAIEPPPDRGWVVTNPPYGVRVSAAQDLRNLYAQFGNVLRAHCKNWALGMVSNSDYLSGHTRIRFSQAVPLFNGGLPVRFYQAERIESL